MDALADIQIWLSWQENQENLKIIKIYKLPSIPVRAVLILAITPLINLYPVLAAEILVRGSRSQQVINLQNNLKQAGCFPLGVPSTGYYGEITELAVKKLQQTQGLKLDGVVGPQTRSALKSNKTCNSLVSSSLLKIGSRGKAVTQLQIMLNDLSFLSDLLAVEIDGIFGKETQVAVIKFQQFYGLNPDGIVGLKTDKSLKNRYELLEMGYYGLTVQDFEILRNSLDNGNTETRYWAAITLAENFEDQIDYTRCVIAEMYDRIPCPTNLVVIASEEKSIYQPLPYIEVNLPINKMLSVLNNALEKSNDDIVQFRTAIALASLRQEPTQNLMNVLVKNVNKQDSEVSEQAVYSLVQIARNQKNIKYFSKELVENLINSLEIEPNNYQLLEVLSYLGASGNIESLNVIETKLKGGIPNPFYYYHFVPILGLTNQAVVFNFLSQAIENKSQKISEDSRIFAIEGLVNLNIIQTKENLNLKNQSLKLLENVLRTSTISEVRGHAAIALVKLGFFNKIGFDENLTEVQVRVIKELREFAENDGYIKGIDAVLALEEIGAIKELKEIFMTQPDQDLNLDDISKNIVDIRVNAAMALARIGSEDEKYFLKNILHLNTSTFPQQLASALALYSVGEEDGKNFVNQILNLSELPKEQLEEDLDKLEILKLNIALFISKFDLNTALEEDLDKLEILKLNIALFISKFDLNTALVTLITIHKKQTHHTNTALYNADCQLALVSDIGNNKIKTIEFLRGESKQYQESNMPQKSQQLEKLIQHIEHPHFYFMPCGGIGDDPRPIRTAFIRYIKNRRSRGN
ncbi:MAG: peptidoglycan-binding domain-containing protein [Planktothrix sp.]